MKFMSFGLALLAGLFLAETTVGQAPELDKIIDSDATYYDQLGHSIAMDGNVMVAGAYADDDAGYDEGSAVVFRFDGVAWVEEQKLTASDGEDYDNFGCSVDVSGDRIVVGAWYDDDPTAGDNMGSIYVFKYDSSSWVLEDKLIPSDGEKDDYFGFRVAIDGKVIVTTAYGNNQGGTDSGAAYVFRRHNVFGWQEETKLLPADTAAYHYFGQSVDVEGDIVMVGARYDDSAAYDAGSVFVFGYDSGTKTWQQDQELFASDAEGYEGFGFSLALRGDVAVVGAPYHDEFATHSGAAYIFRNQGSQWTEEARLLADSGAYYDEFGHSVATTGTVTVVGARYADHSFADAGVAYSFVNHKRWWAQDMSLGASDAAGSTYLGFSVAVEGNRAFVGAPSASHSGASYAGAAYLFSVGEFVLTVDPDTVQAGDSVTFSAFPGIPLDLTLFAVTDVGGTGMFVPLLLYWFNSDYEFTLKATVPPGLGPYDVGFTGFKRDAFGWVAPSTVARLTFQ